jgi:cytochrome b pre-mRNA-processing protein 3
MLSFLFRRLTAETSHGARLFDAITGKTRAPHWYVDGDVPDTIDGRFAVLATIAALVLVRLEEEGQPGNEASVALTERFIHVMESEHRELGLGDPALGKTVRKLVGSLARRTELWRQAVSNGDWNDGARVSLYRADPGDAALLHASEALRDLWDGLRRSSLSELEEGRLQ